MIEGSADVFTENQVATPIEAEREECPSPLSSQDVLQAFRTRSNAWTLERGQSVLAGRTLGTGPPLYFLNGIGGTHELYALIVWLLQDHCRCVVYDYPNSGSNTNRGGNISIEDLADDLFAIADRHHDQRFSLYATSFGSLVALRAMLKFPYRVKSGLIQGGFAHRKLSSFEQTLIRIGHRLPGTLQNVPLRRKIQQQNHRTWFPPFDDTRWQFFLENTGQVSISTLAQRAAILRDCDFRTRLPEIRQPVLLVRSEGEGLVAAKCHHELEAGLPNRRSDRLLSCGHLPHLTHPHRLVKLVRSFLLNRE